jgi:hypothetical protein
MGDWRVGFGLLSADGSRGLRRRVPFGVPSCRRSATRRGAHNVYPGTPTVVEKRVQQPPHAGSNRAGSTVHRVVTERRTGSSADRGSPGGTGGAPPRDDHDCIPVEPGDRARRLPGSETGAVARRLTRRAPLASRRASDTASARRRSEPWARGRAPLRGMDAAAPKPERRWLSARPDPAQAGWQLPPAAGGPRRNRRPARR